MASPTAASANASQERQLLSARDTAIMIAIFAAAELILHVLVNGRYHYFRDELYYIACSHHLSWGYVDQPPIIALTVFLSRTILGNSLQALRLPATLSMIGMIAFALLIVRELGGRRLAMALTGICLFVGPIWLSLGYLMTMNAYDHFIWTAAAYCIVRFVNSRDPKYWLYFGIWCGLGLETKYAISVFGLGVVLGLLFTRERRVFLQKWIWLGGAIALLIFLPNLIWNIHHHWPFVELMHNIRAAGRDVVLSPLQFVAQQILLAGPPSFIIWFSGLVWLFFVREGKYRVLAWTYLTIVITFMVLHGKNYYSTPIYPTMLAAGGVAVEAVLARRQALRPLAWVYAGLMLVAGALFAPMVIPVLPIDGYVRYQAASPIKVPASEKSHQRVALPQTYSDQFGWTEIVQAAAVAYNQIPIAERKDCAIFAQDYGAAGAIDFFGPQYGLPHALSTHQSYFLWGPRGYSGNCMIVLDDSRERLEQLFQDVQYVTTSAPNPYALEQELPVYICRGARFGSIEKLWPQIKHWN